MKHRSATTHDITRNDYRIYTALAGPFGAGLLLFTYFLIASEAHAIEFDRLIIFGDSTTDTGNHFDMIGTPSSPPYYEGRFSNGPVWIDHVAAGLGLPKPKPSRLGGNNYAYGGAQSGDGTSTVTAPNEIPNVGPQIEEFRSTGDELAEDDLIVLWVGHNDLFGGIAPTTTAENLASHFARLYQLGGRNFVVGDMAPVTMDALVLNGLVNAEVERQEREHSDLSIALFSFDSLVSDIVEDALAFGITQPLNEIACAACGPGVVPVSPSIIVSPDPNDYFQWDAIHPTATVHEAIGERGLNAIESTFELKVGDCDCDGALGHADLLFLKSIRQRDTVLGSLNTLAGDLDGDRHVDFSDFLVLSGKFGDLQASYSDGDINLSGDVDFADFLILSENFGRSTLIASVPEPSASALILLGVVLMSWGRVRATR